MKKLGIVAGRGTLPLMLIKACQEQKRPFYVLALKDHAEPDLYSADLPLSWIRLGDIGKGAMIGGMCGIGQDVIPYGIVKGGYEAPLAGINLVGLRRAGVDNKLIFGLQKAYEELFNANDKNFADRVAALAENENYKNNPLVQDVIKFVQNPSKYNILQPEARA